MVNSLLKDLRIFPTKEAEAPSSVNVRENPRTKRRELVKTLKCVLLLLPELISFSETPAKRARYAGIRGKTQGETKESNPPKNAIRKSIIKNLVIKITLSDFCS